MSPAKKKPRYSPHPSVAYARTVVANMKAKTGRSLEEWIALVKKRGPKSEEARREWLKTEHELGTNYAAWIAGRSVGKGRSGRAATVLAKTTKASFRRVKEALVVADGAVLPPEGVFFSKPDP